MSPTFTDQTDIFADETVLYDSWTPEELPERKTERNPVIFTMQKVTSTYSD